MHQVIVRSIGKDTKKCQLKRSNEGKNRNYAQTSVQKYVEKKLKEALSEIESNGIKIVFYKFESWVQTC